MHEADVKSINIYLAKKGNYRKTQRQDGVIEGSNFRTSYILGVFYFQPGNFDKKFVSDVKILSGLFVCLLAKI